MNTLENKAKFFAQYWGQTVAFIPDFDEGETLIKSKVNRVKDIDYLELKPLSSISDEDAAYLIGIINPSIEKSIRKCLQLLQYMEKGTTYLTGGDWLKVVDYLRLKSYAVSWNGITVEQQIEYGWIKLKA